MPPTEKKTVKLTGEKPAHKLLTAISRAIAAGVNPDKVVIVVDMARSAHGVEQAPVWRKCAETLDEYSESVTPVQ